MELSRELQAAGFDGGAEKFREMLAGVLHTSYPNWSATDLFCHPRDALHFCNAVRHETSCPDLPDVLICKTLLQSD